MIDHDKYALNASRREPSFGLYRCNVSYLRSDISPNGEDTHTLRLTSELVELRVGYAKWIRRAKLAEPHLLGSVDAMYLI